MSITTRCTGGFASDNQFGTVKICQLCRLYDPKTGLKLKQAMEQPYPSFVEYTDYREINTGVKIPFKEKVNSGGQPIEYKLKNAAGNTGVSDGVFK